VLKTRVITALILLPIVLLALFTFSNWAWGVFTLAIIIVAAWEWSRLSGMSRANANIFLATTLALAWVILMSYLRGTESLAEFGGYKVVAFGCAAIFWCLVVPVWLARAWRPRSRMLLALAGWAVLFPTWLALLALRDIDPVMLLTFAVIVWVADIAAYFVGKAAGRHKLAPSISPGKTIEGALGGLAGAVAYYFLWQQLAALPGFTGDLWVRQLQANGVALLGIFLLLGCLSILGDLFESWMKRGAGLKDSSNLLPGHGGVLDRIDALTSTLPLAALYVMFIGRG
jgi:phosphatidate cytidylyltransferase